MKVLNASSNSPLSTDIFFNTIEIDFHALIDLSKVVVMSLLFIVVMLVLKYNCTTC